MDQGIVIHSFLAYWRRELVLDRCLSYPLVDYGQVTIFVLLIHSKVSRSLCSERAFIFKDTEQAETFITEFVDELANPQILGGNDYVNLRVSGQNV